MTVEVRPAAGIEKGRVSQEPLLLQVRMAVGKLDPREQLLITDVQVLRSTQKVPSKTYQVVTSASGRESASYWNKRIAEDPSLADPSVRLAKWRDEIAAAFNDPENEEIVHNIQNWHEEHLGIDFIHGVNNEVVQSLYNRYFAAKNERRSQAQVTPVEQFVTDMIDTYHGDFNHLKQEMDTVLFVAGIFGQRSAKVIRELLETEIKIKSDNKAFAAKAEALIHQLPQEVQDGSESHLAFLAGEIPVVKPAAPTRRQVGVVPSTPSHSHEHLERQEEDKDTLHIHVHPPIEEGKEQEHVDIAIPPKDLTLLKEGTREYQLASDYLKKLGIDHIAVPTNLTEAKQYIRAVLEKSGLKDSSRKDGEDGFGPIISLLFGGTFEGVTWDEKRRQEFMNHIIIVQSLNGCTEIRSQVSGQEPVGVKMHIGIKRSLNKLGLIGFALIHKPSFELVRAMFSQMKKIEVEDPTNPGQTKLVPLPAQKWKELTPEETYQFISQVIETFDAEHASHSH